MRSETGMSSESGAKSLEPAKILKSTAKLDI